MCLRRRRTLKGSVLTAHNPYLPSRQHQRESFTALSPRIRTTIDLEARQNRPNFWGKGACFVVVVVVSVGSVVGIFDDAKHWNIIHF
jgi:hypothetical protein